MKYTIVMTTKLMRAMGEEAYKVYSNYDRAIYVYHLLVSDLKATDNSDGMIISLMAEDGRCIDSFKKEDNHEAM